MEKLVGFITSLFTQKSAGLAAAALVLSLVIVMICVIIISNPFEHYPTLNLVIPDKEKPYLVFGFLIGFPTIWYILYIQTDKSLIDVYSGIRKKMTGKWMVTYSASVTEDGRIIIPERVVSCEVRENIIRKLLFVFSINHHNPIFENQEDQIIRDVALRDNEQGGYTVFYYYETRRKLNPKIRELLSDNDAHRREIDIEIFGRITFPDPGRSEKIDTMNGKWYDLNGNMMRIFTLLDLHDKSIVEKRELSRLHFDDIPISHVHFDADMGETIFAYQGS